MQIFLGKIDLIEDGLLGADFLAGFFGQGRRKIALTGAAANSHDEFALILGTFCDLDRCKDIRASRDADQ